MAEARHCGAVEHLASGPRLGKYAHLYHNQGASSGGHGLQPSGLQRAIGVHHDR
jgi:hypothetical protein